jgi:DNA-binding NarL/FixJ family response regulator
MEEPEEKKIVLVIDRHGYVLENVTALLEKSGYKVFGFLEEQEDLLRKVKTTIFDAILIRGGVEPHFRDEIKELVRSTKPDAKIVEHSGGPATLVSDVNSAFN